MERETLEKLAHDLTAWALTKFFDWLDAGLE